MTDVLPSCIGMEGLLYQLYSGFVQANKSHGGYRFLLQGKNHLSKQAYIWTTNSQGVITSGSGWKSGDALLQWEEEFNVDLNGDGIIA